MFRVLLVSLAAVAHGTTTLGHPTPTRLAAGTGLVFTTADIPVTDVEITFCSGGGTHTVEVDATLDLTTHDPVTLPVGTICAIELLTSGALVAQGKHSSDHTATFELELDVIEIDFDLASPIVVAADGSSDASWLELASPGWLSATALGLSANTHVVVDDAHTLHDSLVDEVETSSSAW